MAVDPVRAKSLFLAASELGDPEAVVEFLDRECGSDDDLRARVEALLVADIGSIDETHTHIPADEFSTDLYGDSTAAVGSILSGKYKLIEEIGVGGMGIVYRAQQTEPVKRLVAIKVIKPGMDSKSVLARFDAERQALALMDHPNIAKVLDAGTTEAGRPFFVMELVKGMPITQYCDERKLTIRQRLELFVPVCQAIQHAHQKGIIHRDLKPSNVMVALYDDRAVPKVIDFGVAKATGQALTDQSIMTNFGAVIGTPEYISPEQASLNNLDIDTRSDVYSLGVLLYELLTGSTPMDRKSLGKAALMEILRIVREVEVPRPSAKLSTLATLASVAACRGIEPMRLSRLMRGELDWVLLKALEKDRTRRYDTANALSRDIQRYLSDELVEARPPGVSYRLRKLARRNRLPLTLALTVSALLLSLTGFAWWQTVQAGSRRETDLRRQLEDEQRASLEAGRLARNSEAVRAMLDQGESSLRAGETARAAIALEAARKRFEEGGADEDADRLKRLEADALLLRDLDEVFRFANTRVVGENYFPKPFITAERYRLALTRSGLISESGILDNVSARISASAVRERIVTAFDHLLREQKKSNVRELLQLVDADPYRDSVRNAILASDKVKLIEWSQQPAAMRQPPAFLAFMSQSRDIPDDLQRSLLRAAVLRSPANLSLLTLLAQNYSQTRKKEDAGESLRWTQAAAAVGPANTGVVLNLGIALEANNQSDEAIVCYRRVIEIDPKYISAHNNLGLLLGKKGRIDEAITCYQKAIEIDPNYFVTYANLTRSLMINGRPEEAIVSARKAIELQPNNAVAHYSLVIALLKTGRTDEALVFARRAVELDSGAASSHFAMGVTLLDMGQTEEATACFQKTIALDSKFYLAHNNLGTLINKKGLTEEAAACFRKAIEIDPDNPEVAPAHFNLASILDDKGLTEEAIACYRKAVELNPKVCWFHNSLGVVLAKQGKENESIACYRKAVEIDPNVALFHTNLGSMLSRQGNLDGAIASLRKAIKINPKSAPHYGILGRYLSQQGKSDEAITCIRKAIELDSKLAYAHYSLGLELAKTGKVDEAIASYRKSIEINSKSPVAHVNLGVVLAIKGQTNESIASFRKAIELEPRFTEARFRLAYVLNQSGQKDEAMTCYLDIIKVEPKNIQAYLGLAAGLHLFSGKSEEAAAWLRKAIEIDPKNAEVRLQLGLILGNGQPDAAIDSLRRAIELGEVTVWSHKNLFDRLLQTGQTDEALRICRKAIELDPKDAELKLKLDQALRQAKVREKLPEYRAGSHKPADNAERLVLARECEAKQLPVTATKLYVEIFGNDPKLVGYFPAQRRYAAACQAARAAAGEGEEAGKLDAAEKARHRRVAREWLAADLAAGDKYCDPKQPETLQTVAKILAEWKRSPHLAGLREPAVLAKLPADESKAFAELWAEVDALAKNAEQKSK